MNSTTKNIVILLLTAFLAVGLVACSQFKLPESVVPALPLLAENPPSTVETTVEVGEFENTDDTLVVDARASWMLGADKAGRSYSLVAVGRRGSSDLNDGSENANRLNYDRACVGGKISRPLWNIALLGNEARYRIEAELVLPVTDRLKVMPGVRHENRFKQKRKQTTLRVASCYQFTKSLCGLVSYEIENEGTGADSVSDRIGLGVRFEF